MVQGYNIVRGDNSTNTRRGGVCAYLKESLSLRSVACPYLKECFFRGFYSRQKSL